MKFLFLLSILVASVASLPTEEIAKHSELIVTAKVERVFMRDNVKVATARVLTKVKGTAPKTVEFVAAPTWTCDISDAKVGENVLLFLSKANTRDNMFKLNVKKATQLAAKEGVILYELAHSGRGRVPFTESKGILTVKVDRYSKDLPWDISVNHELSASIKVVQTGKNEGIVRLADILHKLP